MSFRIPLTVLSFLCLVNIAQGQAIVLSASANSGIVYASEDGPPVRVFAGQSIPLNGRIKLAAERTLDLVIDGRKVRLTGPSEVKLEEIAATAKSQQSSSFLGRFLDFLSASVTNTGTAQDVEDYHRRYMTNTKAGLKGWGREDSTIWIMGDFRQVVSTDPMPLQWDSVAGARGYLVRVTQMEAEAVTLLEAKTKSNQLSLPLSQLPLDPETIYELQITTLGTAEDISTNDRFFRFDPEQVVAFRTQVAANRIYRELGEVERPLYVAHRLEKKGYLQAARHDYETLLATDPDNRLYRKVYAGFLTRINEVEAAKALIGDNILEE